MEEGDRGALARSSVGSGSLVEGGLRGVRVIGIWAVRMAPLLAVLQGGHGEQGAEAGCSGIGFFALVFGEVVGDFLKRDQRRSLAGC